MELGSRIRALRVDRGLTQDELAQALHVTGQAVSKWETGQSTPDIELLPQLSVFFGVTIDELFAMTDEMHLARIRRMLANEVDIAGRDFEYAERFLSERLSKGHGRAECLELLCGLENRRAEQSGRRAAQYARQGLALEPERKGLHSGLREAERGASRDWYIASHAELIAYYQDFCAAHPDYGPGWQWLADNLIADGRHAEAEAAVAQMERLMPGYIAPLYRGWIALAAGERAGALELLREVERDYEDEWQAQLHLGDCKARLCMYGEAVGHYERALKLQPGPRYTDALRSIALIRAIERDWAGAARALDGVLKLLADEWGVSSGTAYDALERERDRYDALARGAGGAQDG